MQTAQVKAPPPWPPTWHRRNLAELGRLQEEVVEINWALHELQLEVDANRAQTLDALRLIDERVQRVEQPRSWLFRAIAAALILAVALMLRLLIKP